MCFFAMLTLLTLLLTILLPPSLAAPTATIGTIDNADLNLTNLTIAAHGAASCAGLGGMCAQAKDCCFSDFRCCCMTSLEDQGGPFANYEGFCCAKKGDSC